MNELELTQAALEACQKLLYGFASIEEQDRLEHEYKKSIADLQIFKELSRYKCVVDLSINSESDHHTERTVQITDINEDPSILQLEAISNEAYLDDHLYNFYYEKQIANAKKWVEDHRGTAGGFDALAHTLIYWAGCYVHGCNLASALNFPNGVNPNNITLPREVVEDALAMCVGIHSGTVKKLKIALEGGMVN